jgi:hypothetical protein
MLESCKGLVYFYCQLLTEEAVHPRAQHVFDP